MTRSLAHVALGIGVLLVSPACGAGGSSSPEPSGAGGVAMGSGGAPAGGIGGALAGAGGASLGGASAVPAGQLSCGGKPCHAGGHCAADGSCPSFLGDCFSTVDHVDTCEGYCTMHGFACAEKSCNMDGTGTQKSGAGFSLVSYRAADRAGCTASRTPSQETFDACSSPIWLSPMKPLDDVVRCCCRG
jgi:hypothetical protein